MDLRAAIDADAVDASWSWWDEAVDVVEEEMEADGAHDAGHLRRVFLRAIEIADRDAGVEVDREVLAAAVLFHDVVNVAKDADDRESASAASGDRATRFFRGRSGWEGARLERLRDAVVRHSWSRGETPQTDVGRVVADADRLDAIGAIGLARTFHVAGQMESQIAHPTDPFAEGRELDDGAFAVDHFFEKLLEIRDRMHTEVGREIADERHRRMERFLDELGEELGEELGRSSSLLHGASSEREE